MPHKLLGKKDIIVILAVLAVAFAFLIFPKLSGGERRARVIVDGTVIREINLDAGEQARIVTDTSPRTVIVAGVGEIKFESADCPDKICVRTGALKNNGDTAVCLPAKVIVTVTGRSVDAVTY